MMKKERKILITGGTGFIGSYLSKELLKSGNKIYILARAEKGISAYQRVVNSLVFWDKDISHYLKKLCVVEGDVAENNLGIKDKKTEDEIFSEIEIFFHSAALPELRLSLEEIRKVNVDGVLNILEFIKKCRRLKKFNHLSTAYVVGTNTSNTFNENSLDVGQSFYNTYEQSKFEAEVLLKKYAVDIPCSIFRPSMVMGDSKDGKTKDFRLFYEPLHFFSNHIFKSFPLNSECCLNLVNIDTVVKCLIILMEDTKNRVYHLFSPNSIRIGDLIKLAAFYFKFDLPHFDLLKNFDFSEWTFIQKKLADPFIPYMNFNPKFDSLETQAILKEYGFVVPDIENQDLFKIFDYCNKVGYIKIK